MLKNIREKINKREYFLIYNDKKINVKVKRIKDFKDKYYSLIKRNPLKENNGFFLYKNNFFNSIGVTEKVDLIWVNFDEKIIHVEESFLTNKISKGIENTKFLYILKEGKINKNKIIRGDTLNHQFRN